MRYEFTLPRSFQPMDYLPLRLTTRADDARWLINVIVRKIAARDTDAWGCARLHSDVLRRLMYKPTQTAVVRALEDGGAIETTGYYAGVKAKGYRLGKQFLGDRPVRVPATDSRLIARIEAERKRHEEDQHARWLPVHYALDDEQRAVTITDDAEGILDGLRDDVRLCQDVLVSRIHRRELPFKVSSSTGRCFNSITGLKRELRAALRMAGEPMGSVDIVSAQPALLAMLLSPKFPPNGLKKLPTYIHTTLVPPPLLPASALSLPCSSDVSLFSTSVSDGLFYESLMAETGLERGVVKLSFLRDVLAKRGRYPSAVEDAFRSQFPSVYGLIRNINRHDHATLIRILQRAESWLVIENVAPRLLGKTRVITLHDAIFSRRQDVSKVKDAFEEVFEELGFEMKTKAEA